MAPENVQTMILSSLQTLQADPMLAQQEEEEESSDDSFDSADSDEVWEVDPKNPDAVDRAETPQSDEVVPEPVRQAFKTLETDRDGELRG